jgi:hypothetical protein
MKHKGSFLKIRDSLSMVGCMGVKMGRIRAKRVKDDIRLFLSIRKLVRF